MDFYDPDRATSTSSEVSGIKPRLPTRGVAAGWVMVATGILGYLAVHLVQGLRWDFTDTVFNLVLGLGFLIATVIVTAGVFVLVIQRWLLPDLIAAIQRSDPRNLESTDASAETHEAQRFTEGLP